MPIETKPHANHGSTFEELIEVLMAEPVSLQREFEQQLRLFGPIGTEERKEGR